MDTGTWGEDVTLEHAGSGLRSGIILLDMINVRALLGMIRPLVMEPENNKYSSF